MRRVVPVLLLVVVFLLMAVSTAAAAPVEWHIIGYHVVQPGETLFCIGRAYGVDPWAIAHQNGIVCPNCIHPGAVLAIPSAYAWIPPGPVCGDQIHTPDPCCGHVPDPCCGSCTTYHTVTCGENLFRISLRYGVSMWALADCNGIYDMNYIQVGQVLCIP